VFGAPIQVTALEVRIDFWHQKTKFSVLLYAVLYVILSLAFLTEHRLVTDGQTNNTHRGRASIASRGKNKTSRLGLK